ncbi:hypothetical protein HK100_003617 [Physocladia obscura]|uniref:Integral membrane protein n=1 Tax=Physocladia obscura TaxID=109957 RepID=A0AAD5XEG9_9FUNG|nr:hypothetical protein HK100_003617 [Physocladia obscura]
MSVDWTIVLVVVMGLLVTFQSAAGAKLGAISGSSGFSTLFIFVTGFVPSVVLFLADTRGGTAVAHAESVPAWAYFGGVCGGFIVLSIVSVLPVIGASRFFVANVCFQLTSAMVLDNYALLGLPLKQASSGAISGVVIMILGVFVVGFSTSFHGNTVGVQAVDTNAESISPPQVQPILNATHTVADDDLEPAIGDLSSKQITVDSAPAIIPPPSQRVSLATTLILLLIPAIAGIAGSVQAAMNAELGVAYGSSSFSTMITSGISLIPAVAAFLFQVYFSTAETRLDLKRTWKETPWWCWTIGIINFAFVMTVTYLPDRLGTSVLIGTLVCAEVVSATIADHFGVFGLKQETASLFKIFGVCLMVVGVSLVSAI